MPSNEPVIKVESLYKVFGDEPEEAFSRLDEDASKDEIKEDTGQVVALRDINFDVREGEIFVLMGLSGSGKSTLLRCINGLRKINRGEVYIEGKAVSELSHEQIRQLRRETFGMVFQSFALLPHRDVLGNVSFGLEIQGMPQEERIEKAREVLKTVGLEGWGESETESLSGGMQHRVGLARALAIDPDILLMDEPFSALDPLVRTRMQKELLRLHKRMGKTILFVTHDLNEAIKMGDRIGIINSEGEMVQIGEAEEILLNPANEYVEEFLADVDRPAVVRAETVMDESQTAYCSTDSYEEILEGLKDKKTDYCFLVEDERFIGGLMKEDVQKARDEEGDIKDYAIEVKTADPVDTIKDILPQIIEFDYPVPVVDDEKHFLGEVRRSHVLRVLKDGDK